MLTTNVLSLTFTYYGRISETNIQYTNTCILYIYLYTLPDEDSLALEVDVANVKLGRQHVFLLLACKLILFPKK